MIIEKLLTEAVKTGANRYTREMDDRRRDSFADMLEGALPESSAPDSGRINVGGTERTQVLAVSMALLILLFIAVVKIVRSASGGLVLYAMIPLAAGFVPAVIVMVVLWKKAGSGGLVIDGDRLVIKKTDREYARSDIKEAVYSDRGTLDLYDFYGTRFRRVRSDEVGFSELCMWLKRQNIPCRVIREREARRKKSGLIVIAVGVILMILLFSAYRSIGV